MKYNIFTLNENESGDLIWEFIIRVNGKPTERELKPYGGIKQIAVVDGVRDVQELLASKNESAAKYNVRAEAITKISKIVKKYAYHYADFFEKYYSKFEYKNDGTLYKKWADKLRELPKPSNIHHFSCDAKGWLKVSVWGGNEIGYIEDSVCVFSVMDGGTPQESNDGHYNSSYRPVKPIEIYAAEIEIQTHEQTISDLKREISKLKNKMGW